MKTNKHIILVACTIVLLLHLCVSCQQSTSVENQDIIKYDTISLQYGRWGADIYHISFEEGELNARVVLQSYGVYPDSIPYGFYQINVIAHPQDTLLPIGTYTTSDIDHMYINKQGCSFAVPLKIEDPRNIPRYRYNDVTMSIKRDVTTGDYYVEAFIQLETGENHYIRCNTIARVYMDEDNNPIGYSPNYYPE